MGMYDMLGDGENQIKAFDVALFYDIDATPVLGYMGGLLRNFGIGDKVPWRGLSYKYAPDMLILENYYFAEEENDYEEIKIHAIHDGRYVHTYEPWNDISEQEIKDTPCIITSMGQRLALHSKDEIRQFFDDTKKMQALRIKTIKKYNPLENELTAKLKKAQSDAERKPVLAELNKILSERYEILHAQTDEFAKKYYMMTEEQESLLETLGGYIEALSKQKAETYPKCLDVFKDFLKKNSLQMDEDLYEKYIIWNVMPIEEQTQFREEWDKIKKSRSDRI